MPVALELVLPVLDAEHDIADRLAQVTSCLLTLGVPAAVAVVDGGSSDRTIEAVDDFAAGSLVPIRVLGCSTPGWSAAARRGIGTSRARWVGFGDPGAFTVELDHAMRLLTEGKHIVCLGAAGRRITLAHRSVAELFLDEDVPQLRDIPQHAGIRITAHGRSRIAGKLEDSTVVLTRIES
ncbi:glycosyl transferase, family 2 [Actinoplanes sp. N902-109]|nr:glycosyl transferase, family 2 [Actinoplanes sp. N902-109]